MGSEITIWVRQLRTAYHAKPVGLIQQIRGFPCEHELCEPHTIALMVWI